MRISQILWLLTLWLFATAQALVLTLTNTTGIQPIYISEVHFFAVGNDFPGAIVWLQSNPLPTPQIVSVATDSIECGTQIRGVYYNSQRWKRLFPLDNQTKALLTSINPNYNAVTIVGWLYTDCSGGSIQSGSIVWQVTIDIDGLQSYILAGIEPTLYNNSYMASFRNSVQYLDNMPLGYIYDSYGGIWFIWGVYNKHEVTIEYISNEVSIQDMFILSGNKAYDTQNNPVIDWDNNSWSNNISSIISIMVQWTIATTARNTAQTTILEQQSQWLVLPTTSFTAADITNKLRRRATQLCQWRQIAIDITNIWEVLCFNTDVVIDLEEDFYANKVIIVKNANVILQWSMDSTSPSLDIFVDNGNIVWNMSSPIGFDTQWQPTNNNPVAYGVLLKWNIFIDGLFIPGDSSSFTHKTYIHGKLFSLHSPSTPSSGQEMHISQKFGPQYLPFMNMLDVFARRCNTVTQIGSDWLLCLSHSYQSAPFILIDRNYNSGLIP
jgi:hypothetical protein